MERRRIPSSEQALRDYLQERLEGVVPSFEVEARLPLALAVRRASEGQGAVLYGHNYMEPTLASICDYAGDSLELARQAKAGQERLVIFCGVRFMAETAAILAPEKTVLLPAQKAGCSLADSITGDDVRALRKAYPDVPIAAYVNTYADVKAESDVCVTSGNAAKIVASLGSDQVIMVPDGYLARNVARETGKQILVPTIAQARQGELPVLAPGQMLGWDGRCEIHEQFTVADIERVRTQYPDVVVVAHPECHPDVVAASDISGSTSAMLREVARRPASRYLLLTECSMSDNIAAEVKGASILRLCSFRCPHMAEITLEQVLWSLSTGRRRITVDPQTSKRAGRALERMLDLS